MNDAPAWLGEPAEPLSPEQIARVRDSWFDLETSEVDIAACFYAHLFALAPEVEGLFRGSMDLQRRKFADTLAVVIEGLDDQAARARQVAALGRRHVDYGVTESHYAIVEAALTAALAEALGDGFDSDVREAWCAAYRGIARAMAAAAVDGEVLP